MGFFFIGIENKSQTQVHQQADLVELHFEDQYKPTFLRFNILELVQDLLFFGILI